MKKGVSGIIKILAGVMISAFFIWLTLRGDVPCGLNSDPGCRVSKLTQLFACLKSANYWYLVPYAAILVVIHFCRVIRWGILLESAGKPSFKKLNSVGAIGFMALMVMPFRLGEFARPLLIAQGKLRRSAAMASVVVERVVDGIVMAVVLIVALLCSKMATTDQSSIRWARLGGWMVFAFFFALLVFLVTAYWKREWATRLVHRVVHPFSDKLANRLSQTLATFINALKMVPDPKKIVLMMVLTVVYWGINGTGMMILARGFGLHLEPIASFAVLGVLVAGSMIPAGPAMLGTFHGAVILGMQLFFPGPAFYGAVVAYAWVLWGAQFFQQVLFGLYFLLMGHVSFGSLWAPSSADDECQPAL